MFERFTDRARRVVVLAQEEARGLNRGYIGVEHLLLGLIGEGTGIAWQVLSEAGLALEAAREEAVRLTPAGRYPPSGHIPFTPRAKKTLETAFREMLQLGHNYIGTEHLLLALFRKDASDDEGPALTVLHELGYDEQELRLAVIKVLSGPGHQDQGRHGPTKVKFETPITRQDAEEELALLNHFKEAPEITVHELMVLDRIRKHYQRALRAG